MPIDYQKSKIYKLWSPSKNLIYYGSTTETLARRLTKHKANYTMYKKTDNNSSYSTSYLVLECNDYKIELVEEYPCNNKDQICKKEGEYIKNNECVNKCVAGRSKKEWYDDNKEVLVAKKKIYTANNKDNYKKYYEANKEHIKEWRKKYMVEYNKTDKHKEYMRKYYEAKKIV